MITIKGEIVAIQRRQYTNIVVEDLNRVSTDDLKYITVVILPNWNYSDPITVGDIGYLQFESVEAGTTKWFNSETNKFEFYKYNFNYFINFIKYVEPSKITEFKFE